ncbi:MAG TPA: ferritin-like domain-containing protein [Labilithrix sp.]|jgi:hypothetical protein
MTERAAPRDSLDLRALRDGGRRVIPWDAPDDPALDAARREDVGHAWRSRMEQEHLAVGAFSILATELAEEGCDSVVLALVTRAASDEVRHTDVCRRLAVRHLGEAAVAQRLRGVPAYRERAGFALEDRTLLHVLEMSCLNETFTGAYLTAMLERTTQPTARAAVESLLEDEIDHGRLGWAYLARACEAGRAAVVARALPELLLETVKPVMDDAVAHPEPDDAIKEAHAWLGNVAARAIYARTLRDVILPGMRELGVALDTTLALCRREGWF